MIAIKGVHRGLRISLCKRVVASGEITQRKANREEKVSLDLLVFIQVVVRGMRSG